MRGAIGDDQDIGPFTRYLVELVSEIAGDRRVAVKFTSP